MRLWLLLVVQQVVPQVQELAKQVLRVEVPVVAGTLVLLWLNLDRCLEELVRVHLLGFLHRVLLAVRLRQQGNMLVVPVIVISRRQVLP